MNLSNLVNEFLIDQRVRGNSPATFRYYTFSLDLFTSYFNGDVSELTLSICKAYYLHLTESSLTSVSIQSYIRSLRAFLSWLYDNEYLSVDICSRFKLPKAQRKVIDILSDDECCALMSSVSGSDLHSVRDRLVVSLMLDSGLRLHEVVTLRISDVHLSDSYIIVTGKGNKQRFVPFGSGTHSTLTLYLSLISGLNLPVRHSLIIKVSANSSPEGITEDTVKDFFRDLKKLSGVDRIHPHLLRHTFATRYLENGGNIYSLQMLLGHTSLEMVKKYLHLATARVTKEFVNYSPLDRTVDALQGAAQTAEKAK